MASDFFIPATAFVESMPVASFTYRIAGGGERNLAALAWLVKQLA